MNYTTCKTANLPLCDNCESYEAELTRKAYYTGRLYTCALSYFAGNISGLKETSWGEAKRILLVMARHNRYPRHIAYVLKGMWPEKYEWFEKMLLLV